MDSRATVTGVILRQYLHTISALRQTIEACTDDQWSPDCVDLPFWHEAYHTVFWLANFVGDSQKAFERMPFGVDIDPRLWRAPDAVVSKADMLRFLDVADERCNEVIPALTLDELGRPNLLDIDVNIGDMLVYGIRHCEHHVARLRLHLRHAGIDVEWV
jgi:hypothetical protein